MTVYDAARNIAVGERLGDSESIVSMQVLEIEFEEENLLTQIDENGLIIPVAFF